MAKTTSKTVHEISTILGPEIGLTGKLRFQNSLMIRGTFEGEIEAQGFLHIDNGAEVRAGLIRASSIVIGGIVHGDLEAADRIELLHTARVYGKIRTSRLRIEDGVIFEGRCEMIRNPSDYSPFAVMPDSAG
ncbi:MAG TPA: polymer-forming cytoskeletal protein [Magnetospirillaceae bacterium]|nr:polymer-forming cytoskeletal protein [Magnetospirillaceae bacterium]